MIKNIINSWLEVRAFDLKLKMMGIIFDKKKSHKVRITEKQMEILEYCAAIGADDKQQLSVMTGIEPIL